MFAKLKSMAGSAAESTKLAAQRAKLEGEILYLEREIRLCKERFGTAVWDIYACDRRAADRLYQEHVDQVLGFEAEIQAKRTAIEELGAPTQPAQEQPSAASGSASWPAGSAPPSYSAAAPAAAPVPRAAPSSQNAAAPATQQQNDPGMMAAMFTSVAGMAAASNSTNTVAAAAAPHVANALSNRYSGEDAMQKMAGDAETVGRVGQAVANNPATRALGSALLAGVISSATASDKKR
eukprot:TRINITY_DN3731_c0_g2_i3.p1 TRINITY_DN3731_c0_g2~~TRINITY_DN3731_c0_g2_i3.p1  ORF type:complete len:237 (-),score=64.46 TRINITY_DN3731_c0_g2_i3:404-1114(-)